MNSISENIDRHARNLLRIFPSAFNTDPFQLYRKLRGIERRACNDAEEACCADMPENWRDKHAAEANALLGTDRVRVNGDPRGYALKVDLKQDEELHRDLGGNGIIAPDMS